MELNIKGVNNLYTERYIVTLEMIQKFHELSKEEGFNDFLTQEVKVTTSILNDFLDKSK